MSRILEYELIKRAKGLAKKKSGSSYLKLGAVGSALVTSKGKIYTGTSINADCGIGMCAESVAIASMLSNGEYLIKEIVAINSHGVILPPCGRCREFIYQADKRNYNTSIIIDKKMQ